jgi:hypothetical protein
MSVKTALPPLLLSLALSGTTLCAAQTPPVPDPTPGPTPGSITQSNTRYVASTVTSVITDPSGKVSVSPMAIANALDLGASPSGLTEVVTYTQDNTGQVASRIFAPTGATSMLIDGASNTVTVAASAFGNKAVQSDLQSHVALVQTLSGSSVSVINNMEVDNASGTINDTPSAFGNYYNGEAASGSVSVSQTTASIARSQVTDNSIYTHDSGDITIRPSTYGNFVTLAVNTAGLTSVVNPSATQTNNAGVIATYNGTVTGASGTIVIAPLAVGNYGTTVVYTPPGTK